jgi:hypothetical protein
MVDEEQLNDVFHVEKCGGVPMYPTEHSMFKKRIKGQSSEYIKSREKRVVVFLNRHGFDLDVDED